MSLKKENSTVPLYLKIADDIKGKIDKGIYPPNSRIPTELELGKDYGVSRITMRRALELLTEDGILARKQRIGTYVCEKKITRGQLNTTMSFSRLCELSGGTAGTELLTADLVHARESDIRDLELSEEDDRIIRIRRLRFFNEVPVLLEENHFARTYAFLLAEDLSKSLYDILEKHGIFPSHGVKTIGVCYATREEAQRLGIKENDALLLSRDIVYDGQNRPVHVCKEVINADRFEYRIYQNANENVS